MTDNNELMNVWTEPDDEPDDEEVVDLPAAAIADDGPKLRGTSKLSRETKLAIRLMLLDDEATEIIERITDHERDGDPYRYVAAALKSLDDVVAAGQWLAEVAQITDGMEIALAVGQAALNKPELLVGVSKLLRAIGVDVSVTKRTDMSKVMLPLAQGIATLTDVQAKAIATIVETMKD
jgi:hypothetical protein